MNIPYHLFEKITNKFSEDLIIGSGGFGNVYKGVLYNKELIAVKLLHAVQALDARPFNNEVGNLFRVDHPNIVGLLGYCDEIHSKYVEHNGEKVSCKHIYRILCFEYFPARSLDKHLEEQPVAPDWRTRYNIIKGICEGLNFLHGCEPPIFHLDLKPANILLDHSTVPKLADFGLSRLFSESHTHVTQQRIGTDKYMPPEYRTGGNISDKNDVYSFGVVMIEIMKGYSLYQEMGDVPQFKQEVLAKCSGMIEPTSENRKRKLIHQVRTCIDIAMHCVNSERKNRPNIASILDTLNDAEIDIPSTQTTVAPLSPTIDLRNSLAETLKMMTSELDSIKMPATNMKQVPGIREASSNVEEPLIIKSTEDRETSSYVEEGLIIGRIEEKNKILSILSKSSTNQMVILPIYGIGGIGKTTLAQLVFNDIQFSGYFRVWIHVSQTLDLIKIGKSIISQLSEEICDVANIQMLNNRLAKVLAGKSILIVLDDLWETDARKIDKLKDLLRLGQGSKVILVTTRDEAIARIICSTVKEVPYKLEILTDDKCWAIIKQKSDFQNHVDKSFLEQIGRDIAIKCGGVALAAQSLGYMLRYMTSGQWESVRDSDIWNLSTSEDPSVTTHEVLSSLRLSYSHMHKFLKLCFSYCGVFPKGHPIAKYDLIHQWIALEFMPSGIFDYMQLSEQYVTQLLGMSFLQYAKSPWDERREKYTTLFTMHDLVHDLAIATLANKVDQNGDFVGSSYQYAFLTDPIKPLSSPQNIKALHLYCDDEIELPDDVFSPAKNLLVLDISGCPNRKLHNFIGKLNQLRYLCAPGIPNQLIPKCINKLSNLNYLCLRSSSMKALPDSIGDMERLMHLNLFNCQQLVELPRSFSDLHQLVHLDLSYCEQLSGLPISFADLKQLAHLDLSYCDKLSELPVSFADLKQLVHLDLSYCPVPISESWSGFIKLEYLNLSRCEFHFWGPEEKQDLQVLLEITGKLTKLRYLNLARCMSMMSEADMHSLLAGISDLYNLEHLDLSHSWGIKSIPESIGNLTKLHTLDLSGCNIQRLPSWMVKMASLKFVNMTAFDECSSNLIMFAAANPEAMKIRKLEDLKSLEEAQSMKLIEKRRISELELEWTIGCHKRSMDDKEVLEKLVPPNTIGTMHITGYMSLSFPTNWLTGIWQYLPNVSDITLSDFPKCNSLPPFGQLPNLCILSLNRLYSLEELNTLDTSGELMFPNLDQIHIVSCPKLKMKPFLPRTLSHLSIESSDNVLTSPEECVSQSIASSCSSQLPELDVKGSTVSLYERKLRRGLSHLSIVDCNALTNCSPQIIQQLSSIQSMCIINSALAELPTWLVEFKRLGSITLLDCGSMTSVSQSLGELTSLKDLHISGCEGIWSLPGSIRQLTKLESLLINGYKMELPDITKMCSSISADTDVINLYEYMDSLESLDYEDDIEEHEEHTNELTNSEDGIEEYEEDINNNVTSVDTEAVSDGNAVALLVPSLSAFSIESDSITENLSDVANPWTHANVAHTRRAGARRRWTRRPRQLAPAASSSGSRINNNGTAADPPTMPADVVADPAATSVEDIIRSFLALSNQPGSAPRLEM